MKRYCSVPLARRILLHVIVPAASIVALIAVRSPVSAAHLAVGDILVGAISDNGYTPGVLRVDPVSGDRSFVSGGGVGSGPDFGGVAGLSLEGNSTLYVSDLGLDAILRVDLATGNRTLVAGAGVGSGDAFNYPHAIWRDSENSLLVVDISGRDGSLYRVDMTTGDRTVVTSPTRGTGPTIINPGHVISLPDGDILLAIAGRPDDGMTGAILRVDPLTGDRSVFSGPTRGAGDNFITASGLTLTKSGEIYATDNWNARIYRIDPLTGDRTMVANGFVPEEPTFLSPYAVAEESPGKLIFTDVNYSEIFRADITTVTHDLLSSDAVGYGTGPSLNYPVGIAIVQVPEPASIWLATAAAVLLLATRRKVGNGFVVN